MPDRWWVGGAASPRLRLGTAASTGSASSVVGASISSTIALPSYWIFSVVGVALAIIDLRYRRLPYLLTGLLFASSVLSFVVSAITEGEAGSLVAPTAACFTTSSMMLIIALALPGQLGLGDVAFAGAITFSLGWLSWQTAALGLLAGLILHGAVVAASQRRHSVNALTPMGPAFLVGWLLAVVGHSQLHLTP